jgi:hypothetical protein
MKSVSHTKAFEITQPVEKMFPLFTPEGEKLWVPDWDYKNIMGTTELCENYVFLTRTHEHKNSDAIWIVKKYDPDLHYVQYYKIEPVDKIGVVTVECSKVGEARTRIEVTYKYVALSSAGEESLSAFSYKAYEAYIYNWKKLLIDYFQSM